MEFHDCVSKILFTTKWDRPVINILVAFLVIWLRGQDDDYWKKFDIVLTYLNITIDILLSLQADFLTVVKWWVGASFAVHPDTQIPTGGCMLLEKVMVYCKFCKQNINTKRSTKAEVLDINDIILQILCTRYSL